MTTHDNLTEGSLRAHYRKGREGKGSRKGRVVGHPSIRNSLVDPRISLAALPFPAMDGMKIGGWL